MASFNVVNYSLRPSKSIQRNLVFEGVSILKGHIDIDELAYIGFGSVWFTDFVLAHKMLGINDMISIEADEVGCKRAKFNAPFATVRVIEGRSSVVLPALFSDNALRSKPWMIWLDYDYEFNDDVRGDVQSIIENAPQNSILLITFNASEIKYGRAPERPDRLRELFGDVVPDDLSKSSCKDERFLETLADLTRDYMLSVANDISRPGGFVPAFRLIYRDVAPMITIGGVLPSKGAATVAKDTIRGASWPCNPEKPIIAPHLTIREAAMLQSQLPCKTSLTRGDVQKLGFDLEDDQIEAFSKYYRQYPAFAQIVG